MYVEGKPELADMDGCRRLPTFGASRSGKTDRCSYFCCHRYFAPNGRAALNYECDAGRLRADTKAVSRGASRGEAGGVNI